MCLFSVRKLYCYLFQLFLFVLGPFLTHTSHAGYLVKCKTSVSTWLLPNSNTFRIRKFANLSLQLWNYMCLVASGRWHNCLIQKNGVYRQAYKHMRVLEFADHSSSLQAIGGECNTRWFMILFRDWIVVIASAVIVLAWLTVTLTE